MAERSTELPSQRQVIELLEGEFARAGFDIEDVVIDASARPPRIAVVTDGDNGLDLDSVARLSRVASELLDGLDSAAYLLEVTSPGVERPLTTDKHFRRARGRKVEMTLADGETLTGRLGEATGSTVRLVLRAGARGEFAVRDIDLDTVVKTVVQVEFSPPDPRELELAGQAGKEA
ncbi:ribosome maturation factor RimP [Mycolicibacterium hippocampi]|uniref:Ribosome maturation factor RimP n=1 Tax=Mycolicibacterium hippocampi TaxID=659824 RepID=A0A850PYI6_9MYCO|nr:Bacterial ribosome SSU maturation protein RimP [Mycolicibacterium hippocampi]